MQSQKLVVVDTNLLLHYKRIDELNWSRVAADQVVLVVLPIVLRELEKVKALNNVPRLRERASAMVKWLWNLLDEGFEVTLKPNLVLRFIGEEPPFEIPGHALDRQIQDDYLIAGLLHLANGNLQPVVATADAGVKLKARAKGFVVFTPADDERLVDEQDPRDKELAELRKEVQQNKNRLPRLAVKGADGTPHLVAARPREQREARSLRELKDKHPLERAPVEQGKSLLGGIADLSQLSTSHRNDYNFKLERFYAEYESFLQNYEEWKRFAERRIQLPVTIYNDGTLTANDIDVILTLPTHVTPMTYRSTPERPEPPTAPIRPDVQSMLRGLSGVDVVRPYIPPLPKPIPDWSLQVEGQVARFTLARLKHNFSRQLDGLVLQLPVDSDLRPFSVEVELTSAESPSKTTQRLNVTFAQPE